MTEIVAYLSLGSNLGDRHANLEEAIKRLGAHGEVLRVSSIYETEPVEFTDQPWFLNCVAKLHTGSTAEQLLADCLAIEKAMGRERVQPKGPRVIDIDIVFFGDAIVNAPGLKIPHPATMERGFVLEPMAEIAPDFVHPGTHRTMVELRDALPTNAPVVRREVRPRTQRN